MPSLCGTLVFKVCFYVSVSSRCTAGVPGVVPNSISPHHPAICTCSNYYPISKKYRTITARNPHTQATTGCKNPGREKLAGSSNSRQQLITSLHVEDADRRSTPLKKGDGRKGRWEDTDVPQKRRKLYLLQVSVAQVDKISYSLKTIPNLSKVCLTAGTLEDYEPKRTDSYALTPERWTQKNMVLFVKVDAIERRKHMYWVDRNYVYFI